MAKKLVTINIDKNLSVSTKSVEAQIQEQEKKEIENFGIVEINNASATKKIKANTERGFEKNISGETKKSVKTKTSQVEDYFDFSFRTNRQSKPTESAQKTAKKSSSSTKSAESVVKTPEKVKDVQQQIVFDSDANQIVRVARIGSLFDCDIRMMNA